MRSLNKTAKSIMDTLTEGLAQGQAKKIDNGHGFMAVHVEYLQDMAQGPLLSVTHYYEQNGDLMSDPDMTFIRIGGEYYPVSYRQDNLGLYQEAIIFEDEKIKGIRTKLQADLASFSGSWMKNIKDQQKLIGKEK